MARLSSHLVRIPLSYRPYLRPHFWKYQRSKRMLSPMPALTFATLSAELAQALAEQVDTPPATTVRCTLGRGRVLVLVEYPLDSAQAEIAAEQTLDWLEPYLRHYFDTTGLPEETADLAAAGEAVSVRLYLKHSSEAKPFTMRSFVWKVADGFDDIFSESQVSPTVETRVVSDRPYTDWMGREIVFHAASEPIARDLLPDADEDELILAELEEEYLHLDLEAETELDLDPTLGADWEATIVPDELPVEIDPDWETNLDLHKAYAPPDLSDLDLTPVDLPEEPAAEPSEADFFSFDTTENDADSAVAQSDKSLAEDLEEALEKASKHDFSVYEAADGDSPEATSPADLFDLEQVLSDQANLWDGDSAVVVEEGAALGQLEEAEAQESGGAGEIGDADLTGSDFVDSKLAAAEADDSLVSAQSGYVQPESTQAENTMDAETDYLAALESADFELEDFESAESAERTDDDADQYEPEEYEPEDAAYFLGHGGDGVESFESVASVDEGEVQRQGEQWQQSRGNARILVGALGFVVVGALGFVLTRPCVFGQCDRIQVAQAQGDEAIEDLRLNDSLAGVDQSRAELQRAIQLLKPIPPWSRYHSQAQQILPAYQDQIGALDQVSVAQEKAYQAAVNSQNPPHPVSTWNQVAADWRTAISALEAVPPDSLVRDLAERKLVEYRANLSTIKLRIDAESKAEESMRQAQQAASLGTQQAEQAESAADWEAALASWESAVNSLRQIPQGTQAYSEAQTLLTDYQQAVEAVRDRTQQARSNSRSLSQAKQLAAAAQQDEADEQWSSAAQNWTAAVVQLRAVSQTNEPQAEAQALLSLYTSALSKAENNLAVALRFQPVEPRFFMACGTTNGQKCTYSMQGGNVRLDLFQGYDSVIDQTITPPDQRADIAPTAQIVSQANQLLKEVTVLSTQAQVPLKLYDAKGDFLASYQPDLNGFVR